MEERIEFNIYLTNLGLYNEGELVGKWLSLPITQEQFNKDLKEIGIDNENYEEYFFTDWEIGLDNLEENLGSLEYANFNEMNLLAYRLQKLNENNELDKFESIIDITYANTLSDAINYTYNLDGFDLLPDINSHFELGKSEFEAFYGGYELPTGIKDYIDYGRFGEDRVNYYYNCDFTSHGFVFDNGMGILPIYNYNDFKKNGKFKEIDIELQKIQQKQEVSIEIKEIDMEQER